MVQKTNPEILKDRDSILEGILFKVQGSKILSDELMIRGGGALHFFYGSQRYSSDVDFVSPNFDSLVDKLEKELVTDINLGNNKFIPKLKKKNERAMRISYARDIPQSVRGIMEIDKLGHLGEYKETRGKYFPVKVEASSHIYADKINATLHRMELRGSLKPSDLFDFEYIANTLKTLPTDNEVFGKATLFNYLGWNKINAENAIKYIIDNKNHEQFRKTLRKEMSSDFYETQRFNAEYFQKSAEHLVKYLPIIGKNKPIQQDINFKDK